MNRSIFPRLFDHYRRNRWVLLLWAGIALAQSADAQLGVQFMPGRIIRHTPNLGYDIPPSAWGATLNIRVRNKTEREWVRYYGYPQVDLRLGYQDFRFPEVLGVAFYAMPEITFFPIGKDRLIFPLLSAGTGLGYVTRRYDARDNPDNNSISSRLNNATSLRIGLQSRPFHGHHIGIGLRLTHFSNARFKAPNLGVNVLAWEMSYQFSNADPAEGEFDRDRPERAWFAELSGIFALNEYAVPGGPKYPGYSLGAMVGYPISRHQSLVLFPFWQYASVEPIFSKNVLAGVDDLDQVGHSISVALGLESRFHRLAVSFFWGLVVKDFDEAGVFSHFNLIRMQYLVPLSESVMLTPGIQFKSKEITAEYIGLLVGIRLLRKYRS